MPLALFFFVHGSKEHGVVRQTRYNFVQGSLGDGTISVPIQEQRKRGFAKSRPTARYGPTAQRSAARGPRLAMPRRPVGPVLIFHSFLSSGESTRMHRSASGLGVQNGRRWVWIRLPFRACLQGWRVTLASRLTVAGGQKIARVYKQNFTGRVTLQPGTT